MTLVLLAWLTLAAPPPPLSRLAAEDVLFLDEPHHADCREGDEAAQIRCLLQLRYAADAQTLALATRLYDATGTVAGQLPAQDFEGGYRGLLHLVPRLPTGALRHHLQWASASLLDFDDFLRALGGHPTFRTRNLELRFFESLERRTPSAFAAGRLVAWNVNGSLFRSEAEARATLFHELFHLNDQARGDWSALALGRLYDGIVARCGVKTACLTPYTPDLLKVRGGTYYAFQPGNGVQEYAADLARRYFLEHRAHLHHEPALPRFKCGPPENAEAWQRMVDTFFDGVDLIPPCGVR